ncbi:MAG TPA: transglutaminase-like domain-containing protein [Thermoanaerobaculia bacterium]|nr:transglutaminase-like domain-containing protein [Thermoanaerobaculia bacterium]
MSRLQRPIVTILTIVCFTAVYVVPREAYAASLSPQNEATTAGEARPARRVEAELLRMERLLDRIDAEPAGSGAGRLRAEDREALRAARAVVEAEGNAVLAALAAVTERLQQTGAPEEVRERNRLQIERIGQGLRNLAGGFESLAGSGAADEAQRLADARRVLKDSLGTNRHNPLDPNRLPFRPRSAPVRTEVPEPLAAAAGASSVVAKAAAPAPGDLAETPDVRLTPGVRALADSLGGEPRAIYNWVRRTIRFVPTFGSIQGSEGCRLSRECNAHDTASLLIALLRASGVPARYVTGRLEVDPARFRSAMGDFQDLESAVRLAASGGVPVTLLLDAANQPVAVRMDHVWVEAFVPYVPSRGAAGGNGSTWVPLDPSLKPSRFQAPVDVAALTGANLQSIVDELQNGAVAGPAGSLTGAPTAPARQRLLDLIEDLQSSIDAQMPDATVGEVLGAVENEAATVPVLPASLQERILAVTSRTAALPAAARHQIALVGLDETGFAESFRFERSLPELAGKRVTLHFLPASDADAATIRSFGGLFEVPPYLVRLRPTLFVEGEPVIAGVPQTMGTLLRLRVRFQEPGESDEVEHRVTAGTFGALALDLQQIGKEEITQRRARLEAVRDQLADVAVDTAWDDLVGEPLHLIGQSYFLQVEAAGRIGSHQSDVVSLKRPAEALVTFAPTFSYLFGTAVEQEEGGFNIDVRRYLVSPVSRTGDEEQVRAWVLATGSFGSAAEHEVFEHLLGARSVSSIKLIGEANARGIPVFRVDSANLSQVLPLLQVPSPIRNDVINAVNAGRQVLVPQQQITFFDWTGVGYIVLDPESGAAAYLISGGLAGGGTAEPSEGGGALKTIGDFLDYITDGARGLVTGLIKAGTKIAIGADLLDQSASAVGAIALVVGAVIAAYTTYQETGSAWKATAAAVLDVIGGFLVGLAVAKLATLAFFSGGFVALFLAAVLMSILMSLLLDLILGLIIGFLRWSRRRGELLAWWMSDDDERVPTNGPSFFTPGPALVGMTA